MSDIPVSKHDAEYISNEYKKTVSTVLHSVIDRIKKSGRDDKRTQITIKINRETVFWSAGYQTFVNQLTPNHAKQIQNALENPEQVKDSVSIVLGNEEVLHVKDGKVITDSLQPISNEPQLQEQGQESNGKNLVQYAQEMLSRLVEQKQEDESLRLESKKYIFTQKGESLSVMAKDGRGEVLNNNALLVLPLKAT